MINLGLTATERSAYEKALRSSHVRRVRVYVTDLAGKDLAEISNVLLDGQIVVDMEAEVTRSATLSFLDPAHALSFDTNAPDDGALYADRMLRIVYEDTVEALDRVVVTPVFFGPVTKLDRTGETVNVEAQGKEALLNGAVFRPLTLQKGFPILDSLLVLTQERGGETRFRFEDLPASVRLPAAQSLDRWSSVWESARAIAAGANRQIFYAADGHLCVRAWPQARVYTFTEGDGGDVLSRLSVSYEMSDVKNTIVVGGGIPKGGKSRVWRTVVAPSTEGLSPARLGRNGVPRYLVEIIENDGLRSNASADEYGTRILQDRMREVIDVSFDALPIPHLEPGDVITVQTAQGTFPFRLRKFSLPLTFTGDPVMTVGDIRRVIPNRKRLRK